MLVSIASLRRRRAVPGTRLAAPLAAPLCALAVVLGGCGSSSAPGTSADPAGVVPAAVPVYVGADVRPEGAEKDAALAAGKALTHQPDPYKRLLAVLQTPGSPALDFNRDVAPWLGKQAGLFFTSGANATALLSLLEAGLLGSGASTAFPYGPGGAQGAIVLDTSDVNKARTFVEGQAARAGAQSTQLDGVTYQHTTSGIAFAIVDRFAAIGSESGVRAVIETAHGAAALSQAGGYAKLLAAAPAGALAHVYTDYATSSARKNASGNPVVLLAGPRQTNISLVASPTSLTIDADATPPTATGVPGGLLASAAEGGRALERAPSDSWLAIGLGNLGSTLSANITALQELTRLAHVITGANAASGGLSVSGLIEGLLAPLSALAANSAQARADFTSWMGSGLVFASGTGLLELKAAVVIESRNAARSRAAVAKLAVALAREGDSSQRVVIAGTEAAIAVRVTGLPVTLDIAAATTAAGPGFVIGLGEGSVAAALNPSSTLAGSSAHSAAASSLGEGLEPSLIFQAPTLLGLLESVGLAEDPSLSKVVPYLRAITTVSGGGHGLGNGVERYKLVVGLRPAGG